MSKTIFNREYDLNENSTIKIYLNKTSLLNSDIIENVILKSNKEEIEFDIIIILKVYNIFVWTIKFFELLKRKLL